MKSGSIMISMGSISLSDSAGRLGILPTLEPPPACRRSIRRRAECVGYRHRNQRRGLPQTAASPHSLVLLRIACSIGTTKTFPSPIFPVRGKRKETGRFHGRRWPQAFSVTGKKQENLANDDYGSERLRILEMHSSEHRVMGPRKSLISACTPLWKAST
jgi:hypothetical protein